ncbi:MAG: hypothetical protein ACKPKO_33675, partial [Candidatus Fonsibacter sp.]
MENQVEAIVHELTLRNDQMKAIEATVKGSEEFALLAEARLRSEEQALRAEAQQREAVIDMTKEVASGQASALRQYEAELQRELAEMSLMESQASFVLRTADAKMQAVERVAEQAQAKSAEYSRLLSDSVSAVYTLEDQRAKLQKKLKKCSTSIVIMT